MPGHDVEPVHVITADRPDENYAHERVEQPLPTNDATSGEATTKA